MAYLQNKIGTFSFIALKGAVQRPFEMDELDQRPGTNGTGITLLGIKGEPFVLRSQVDQVDIPSAEQTLAAYIALTRGDVVPLIQDDYDFRGEDLQVRVRRVTLVRRIVLAANYLSTGLNPPSGAWLECDWELILISDNPAEEDEEDDDEDE